MASGIKTYNYGFKMEFTKDITKQIYIAICMDLTKALNYHYGVKDHVEIQPEPIIEGGFVFTGNKYGAQKWYKTMRHFVSPDASGDSRVDWPYVPSTVMQEWNYDSTILMEVGNCANTMLKAFNNAPKWTIKELRIIKAVLNKFGIKCTAMPKGRTLTYPN